jgi:drug/metabolite transporter (DMT)-like permease
MASIQMTLGAIIMIVIAILVEPLSSFKITFKSMTALFYLAIFGTVVAFLGYYWLLQRMKAITVSQISFVTPLIAVFLGFIFLSESFTFLIAIGSTLILAGVTLVARE